MQRETEITALTDVMAKFTSYIGKRLPNDVKDKLADVDDPPFIKPWMIDLADAHYAANITHAQTKLAWEPHHRLRDTLPSIIEFLKNDTEAFYASNKLPKPETLASP